MRQLEKNARFPVLNLLLFSFLRRAFHHLLRPLNRPTALTMHSRFSAISLFLAGVARAQTDITSPVSEDCGPSVVCVNRYANVLP